MLHVSHTSRRTQGIVSGASIVVALLAFTSCGDAETTEPSATVSTGLSVGMCPYVEPEDAAAWIGVQGVAEASRTHLTPDYDALMVRLEDGRILAYATKRGSNDPIFALTPDAANEAHLDLPEEGSPVLRAATPIDMVTGCVAAGRSLEGSDSP